MIKRLGLGLVLALVLGTAPAGADQLYWQCAPPTATNPQGSWCPASSLYPIPISAGGLAAMAVDGSNATLPAAYNNFVYTPPVCDGFTALDGAVTSAAPTLFSSASASFVAGDAGKPITIYGAGAAGVALATTIASVTNSTNVVLTSGNASGGNVTGAIWGFGTDYSTQINAALTAGARLPVGICGHTSTITMTNKQLLEGQGSGVAGQARTTLMWLGAVGGDQVLAGTGTVTSGIVLGNMKVDGLCSAANGIKIRDVSGSQFLPTLMIRHTAAGADIDAVLVSSGTQLNDFYSWEVTETSSCSTTAKGITVGAGNTTAPGSNTNENNFYNLRVSTVDGAGLSLQNFDSNKFFGYAGINNGTGLSIDLLCSNEVGKGHARSNYFYGSNPQSGVTARATGCVQPSVNNTIEINNESAAVTPTIESGATLFWRTNSGAMKGGWSINSGGPWGTGAFSTLTAGIGSQNWLFVPQASIGAPVLLEAHGNDTDIGLALVPKGAGTVTTAAPIVSTLSTGTAPFTVASTTNVANLNASSLGGATFAAPGAIGGGTASAGTFTALTGTSGSIGGLTNFGIRDTSAAFDVILAATSGVNLSANRTLTLSMGNVAHSLSFGATANTITFPGIASYTVAALSAAQTFSAANTFSNSSIKMTGITTGTNADTVCLASDGTLLIQAAACTISSMRFKNLTGPYKVGGALATVERLEPIVFKMKPQEVPNPDSNYEREQIGLSAENVAAIEPRCAIYEPDGVTPKSYRQECLIAVLVAGMQAQQREIEKLKARQ